ncbi:MAG: hypothetical protein M0Q91_17180 [Methanoregula sp.]|jgi:hypothetical protein|nr:hypothetical protein [Methanoregula sp.]
MKTSEFRIILPVLLLAFFIIIPIVTAVTNFTPSETWKYPGVPEHYIPPEYFADSKPATPLTESEMINIVISGQTFEQFTAKEQPGILALPLSYLDFSENFANSTSSPIWHYEKNPEPDTPVALIRMSDAMYVRMLAMSDGKNLELPISVYVHQYSNLTSLNAQIHPDGIYLKATAPGIDETGTRQSPTVPTVIITTPRIQPAPGTKPTPLPVILAVAALGCVGTLGIIRKMRYNYAEKDQ